MYGLTRGAITLLGAGVAGLLVWLATQIERGHERRLLGASTGCWRVRASSMAFSQILGGWTKWGWPRLSLNVFLIGFVPVLVAAGWVLLGGQPDPNWFRDHVRSWSDDIAIRRAGPTT